MKKLNKLVGNIGENLALNFLVNKNYIILEKNYRFHKNEVDIIAKKNNIIIFVEIKSRVNNKYGYGEEAVNYIKQKQIIKVANYYLQKNNFSNYFFRFDVLTVKFNDTMVPMFNHIKDAFRT